MDKLQLLHFKINSLQKRLTLLENENLKKNQNHLELIVSDFIEKTICVSDQKNSIFLDQNLKRYGVYSRFLQFYSLRYFDLNLNFTQESFIKEFSSSLVKTFSYNLTNNRIFIHSTFRDIAYKGLEFKNLIPFTNSKIHLEAIIEAFIESEIEISLESKKIVFDKKLLINGVYPRFLSFYFLHYSGVPIDLSAKNILKCFDNGLVTKISYEKQKNCMIAKRINNDIVYKGLKFKDI